MFLKFLLFLNVIFINIAGFMAVEIIQGIFQFEGYYKGLVLPGPDQGL